MIVRRMHPGSIALPAAARVVVMALAVVLLALRPLSAAAHETDQYTLPLGRTFADLRFHFSRLAYDAIADATAFTNAKIRNSLRDGRPTAETAQLQSADFIAHEVWANLFAAITTNEGLDAELIDAAMQARYPGLILAYEPDQYLYDDPLLVIDLTKFVRTFFRGDTVNVGGTLFGTDKFLHFIHLGAIYHTTYLEARREGLSEQAAVARAVEDSIGANPVLSENAFLGTLSTGIRSNADLAADYAGLKFYRNLTEPVRIGATQLPPMLIRDGFGWRLDERVRPGSDFFAAFVTPHFNEALNPNGFLGPVGERVRKMLRVRCFDVVDWYRDERGRLRNRAQFAAIEQELSTFYGEPYGYQNDGEDTVSIATTCFEADGSTVLSVADRRAPPAPAQADAPLGPGRDRFGRTELWWAAREGQRDAVERLIAAGEKPNARDIDGEAPLHAAARGGHAAIVELLIARGADLGARDRYGVTPLLLAIEASQPGVARLLLARGADANARDSFGRTPLHQAALQGDRALAALLLDHGADRAVRYGRSTPAQLAAREGYTALADWLAATPARSVAKRRPSAAGGS
jgi:ankyrin repeat protein